jgi:5'(3')-deoxyribonucleotidase
MSDTVFYRKEGLITADMDGETVMMDIETGKYYNLGRTGGDIWKNLENHHTVDRIVDEMTEIYDVERAECEKETKSFLTQLIDAGLAFTEEK